MQAAFRESTLKYRNTIARVLIQFEAATAWGSRHGRIDIRIDDGTDIAVVEIKATNWDRLKRGTIRRMALRHARQIWRYIDDPSRRRGNRCPLG
jgi:hypothetical protein